MSSSEKILSLNELSTQVAALRERDLKVVLCHGTFDLVHTGHIRYLQRARLEGNFLIVTLTADKHVKKGPGRPVFPESLRAENLAALSCVDLVCIIDEPTAVSAIEAIRPDVYAKGIEYKDEDQDISGNISLEKEAVLSLGGKVFYSDELTFSSSHLLNTHFGLYSEEIRDYVAELKNRYSIERLVSTISGVSEMNVCVIGDTIIDSYVYVEPLGQTGKGNVLAVVEGTEEKFAGGAVAVANHLSSFVKSVTLLTGLGSHDSHLDFLKAKLGSNVRLLFEEFMNSPTLIKRRFVDQKLNRFFETYNANDQRRLVHEGNSILGYFEDNLSDFDLVIVPDFGNGFLNSSMIDRICERSPFLAVNTQINSGNRGFHVINKYPRADFISLNEPELRLASHNQFDPIPSIGRRMLKSLDARYLAVTRGTDGSLMLSRDSSQVFSAPALSTRVVDRVGAGDAYLSLAAITLCNTGDPEIANFIASIAGALDVQIVCNREPLSRQSLMRYMTTLLK